MRPTMLLCLLLLTLAPAIIPISAQEMDTLQAARLANRAYLNHRNLLFQRLESDHVDERLRAMALLADLGDSTAIPKLMPFMDELNRSEAEIIGAIRALATLGASSAAPVFAALTENKDEDIRTAAYNGMAILDALGPEQYLDMARERTDALRATGVVGLGITEQQQEEAAAILREALREDSDPHVRRMAAIALGDLGDRAHGEALTTALTDPDPRVRALAAQSIRRLNYTAAIPHILMAMEANIASQTLNRTLVALTGQDFGFRPAAPSASRRTAIDKAFRWFTANADQL